MHINLPTKFIKKMIISENIDPNNLMHTENLVFV